MNISELRRDVIPSDTLINSVKRNPIILILNNLCDPWNSGGATRLADALACREIYYCGTSPYPPNSKLNRASIGTQKFIKWSHYDSILECLKIVKSNGYLVICLEITSNALDYREIKTYNKPIALIINNEVEGANKEVLDNSDLVLKIPMHGFNNSLNVCMALAIIGFDIVNKIKI